RRQPVLGKTAVAHEQATRPCRLLLDLPVEDVEVRDADRTAVPLGLDEIGVVAELETAVDLFAPETERLLRRQSVGFEQAAQEALEGVAARMGLQRCNRQEITLELADLLAIERSGRFRRRRPGIVRTAFESVDQGLEAGPCVLHVVRLAGPLLQRFPVCA